MLLTEYIPFSDYKIIEDNKSTGKFLVGGVFQKARDENANGRAYPRKLWERVLSDEKIKERLNKRRMLGELDHPAEGKTSLPRVSHVVTELKLDPDDFVRGKYEVFNTPHGQVLKELLRQGVTLGISSRGNGDLKQDKEG